ncbi:MAG: adenylate/guanylate cyclase domain-containing protein [Leptospirales bacterium]|nr:adenylate/guanylate cyclase domain-containing protein [Leptospirales bacterium]
MTLEQLLADFPWPPRYLEKGSPLNWIWNFRVRVPRAALWPQLADTSRFNRAISMPEMTFQESDGVLKGSSTNFGIVSEWTEIPWAWNSEQSLTNSREYSRGFVHFLRVVYVLDPVENDTATDLTVYFGWIPNLLGRMVLPSFHFILKRNYTRILKEMEVAHAKQKTPPTIAFTPRVTLTSGAENRIAQIRETLVLNNSPELVDKLVHYLTTADDLDLYRIRALALANQWSVPWREMLRLCLYATRSGLLTISWDVICPHCRGVRQEVGTLGDVPKRGACEVCEIEFENDAENSLEITFHLHSSIRVVPRVFYCSAEPVKKPHIAMQQHIPGGASRRSQIALRSGKYRLRVKGEKNAGQLLISPEASQEELEWIAGKNLRIEARNDLKLLLHNPSREMRSFVIEEAAWDQNALKPSALFNLQEFHDIFASEALSPDLQLEIGEQTILFTDMVGSTRFYATSGDAQAFTVVKKHFEDVYNVVRECNGAVIKTIGDAVMASFANPPDALRAGIALQKLFGQGRDDSPIRLRVSIHTGQCIAVNLNSGIDYFGSTVNLAAKIQALANAHQIVFTEAFVENADVRSALEQGRFKPEALKYDLVGVNRSFTIYRIEI